MAIVNPYLKKKPLGSATGAAASGSRGATSSSSSSQPAPIARRQPQPAGPNPTGGSIRRPPNASASSSKAGATAPKRPAQQQQHRQSYAPGKSSGVVSANGRTAVGTAGHHTRPATAASSASASAKASTAKASAAINGRKAVGPSALTNRPSAPTGAPHHLTKTSTTTTAMARQPTTLKAQLKQQIADLKRAKLLKQQERQAAERKRQLDEKRRRDEAVQAQARAREEAERKKREEVERRQRAVVERQRAEEEKRRQVRHEVGQVLSSLVALVEREGSPDQQQEQQQQVEKEKMEEEKVVETKGESKEQVHKSNESTTSISAPSSAGPSSSMPSPHASPAMHPPFHYPPDAYQHYQFGPHGPVPTTTMGPPPHSHHPHDGHSYHHHQPPMPVPVMMMMMPPSQQQHPPHYPYPPVGQDGTLPHHSKTPSAGAASSSSSSSSHRPSKKVTPSPYGVTASAYSSTPTALSPGKDKKRNGNHYQQQQQQHHSNHPYQQHSFAESTSPNKALSFTSPTKSASRGRGGGALSAATSPNRKWESPVDHGAIIENIFKEMGEFETGKAGNDLDGSPSSHGSFHIDISPIKIDGLADSPPREEAGAASSSRPDMPQLTGKGRGTGGSGKDSDNVAETDRRQEQAPPPQAPYRQPPGTWMSPHPGATPTRGPPPPPPASAYFAAYSQQFPFGFPPHAYPYPFPTKMPSPSEGSGETVPATPSSSGGSPPQQGMFMPMPSPFGAWPTATATATPGRPASVATEPATPSNTGAARTPANKTSGTKPESANKTKGSVAKGASPRPSPNKKAGTTILHERIMEPPSPFANSYEVVKNPIVITKNIGGSFGIDMKQDTRSVLVDSYALSKRGEKKDEKSAASPKKKRRRVYFSAMITVKAEKQNSRKDVAKKGSDILRPGDIILTVDGRPTGGLLFKQAAALFAVAKTPAKGNESGAIQCVLTVARPKIMAPGAKPSFVAVPQQKVPLVLGQNGLIVSGDFNDTEIKAVLDGYKSIRKYGDLLLPTANYGAAALGFLRSLLTHPTIGRDLACRDMNAIITKLSFTKAKMVLAMNAAAIKHFSAQWQKECERASKENIGSHADGELKLMTDAKRSTLRLLPRPGKGCKCGAEDHRFAHDERCLLYRDIIPHVKAQDLEPFKRSSKKMRSRKAEAEIESAIVSALQERQIQAKRDQEDERQEAMFVDLMERTQVTKLKKAVFAPGQLSVAIISAVATLADQSTPSRVEESNDSDDDSDDDDDIPLNALSSSAKHPSKKQKVEATVTPHHPSFTSIAEILLHISKTWGHLLKEYDTNAEYAWHLKLGGLDSGESLDQYRRNPRPAESLSFENVQFLLNNTIMSRLQSPPPLSPPPATAGKTSAVSSTGAAIGASASPTPSSSTPTASAAPSSKSSAHPQTVSKIPVPTAAYVRMMDELTVAILASQECTGLWDEIQSLLTSEVLQVDRNGTVVLRKDWQDNVGASILLDGNAKGWFRDQDPSNSFSLHEDVRSLVPDIWVRRDKGWAFADSKPEDGVEFSENEYLDIKREYIRDYGTHFDQVDGVGRFGDKRYGM